MLLGPGTAFRGGQEAVVRAVVRGETPILQVAATSEGKSLSFLLPASCSPEGVTIVIVPILSLRADMKRRCQAGGIVSHAWQGRQPNVPTSTVFVTPESAVTEGFRTFVNRLQARQALDRVVLDECHVLLPDPMATGFGRSRKPWGRCCRTGASSRSSLTIDQYSQ